MDDPIPEGGATLPESLERFEPKPEISISSKKCRICQSPARRDIDTLIIIGWDNEYLSKVLNFFVFDVHGWLSPKRVDVHARRHISLDDNHIVEHLGFAIETARALGLLDPEAEPRRTSVEVEDRLHEIVDRGTTAMEAGIIVPNVSDLLKAAELLEKLDNSPAVRAQNDFARFTRAVMSHVDKKTWAKINSTYLRGQQKRLPPSIER